MKKILVTGGAGYIGSHVCKILNKHNYKITVVDNLSTGKRKYVKWGDFYRIDIRDKNKLNKIFKKKKFDSIIHLAAKCLVEESVLNVDHYYENNVIGTKNILDLMIKFNVKNIVFSSTCSVYGVHNKKINEKCILNPINPYGETKKICEELLETYSSTKNIKYMSLRYFNAAGADKDLELGEDRNQESHLIPIILKAIKFNKVVKIYGNNYSTKDKTCVRDYIHVSDIARAHLESLKYLQKNKKSEILNIGTGSGLSILEIINLVSKITNRKIKKNFFPRRIGDPAYLVSSNLKIKKLLNFQNKFSRPENIINTAFQWSKKIL